MLNSKIFNSLSLVTFVDHCLTAYFLYGMPVFLQYCKSDINTIYLYGTLILSYSSRPLGVFLFHLSWKKLQHHTMIINLLIWLLSIIMLLIIPLLNLSSIFFYLLFFTARTLGQLCMGAESTLARMLLIHIPQHSSRLYKNAFYEQTILFSYLLVLILITLKIHYSIFISLLLFLATVSIYLRLNNKLVCDTIVSAINIYEFSIYILCGISVSYIAYSIGITYCYQSNLHENYLTTALLAYQILLLTFGKTLKLKKPFLMLTITTLTITLTSLSIVYGTPYILTRMILITAGILFDLYFYSTIPQMHLNQGCTNYMNFGIQQWLASLSYGKLLPWLLFLKTSNVLLQYAILVIILLPFLTMLIMIVLQLRYSKTSDHNLKI